MKYFLHPEAALEHEEQVAWYESRTAGLGRRYHAVFLAAIEKVCEGPRRYKVVQVPGIRRVALTGFPFSILFREVDGVVQVLAVAPWRRRPGYWAPRL
ncbi:MAG: type II toxin-antitoxin system RelE/ParE family toxin [Proteobacteria bacterium]|nr:type II toxin-antitoxin system RelE/ParE family toxin [Pseudomonadota bacterium]